MVIFSTAFADSQDELTKSVASYEITMPRIEAYEAALGDLVKWARAHPNESKPLRNINNQITSLEAAAKQFESVPAIRDILARYQLTGKDMTFMPTALLSSRAVVFAEKRGMTMPPGQFNAASVALVRSNYDQVEKSVERIMSHLAVLRGERKAAAESVVSPAKPTALAASVAFEGKGACAYLTPEVIADLAPQNCSS